GTTHAAIQYDDDWRFLAKADVAISDSAQDDVANADYIEASVGWAYRPVENDRFNALFKYTYLHDLPGAQQVNSDDVIAGPKQRSHVLSGDFIYDLSERLSVGAKYGVRMGEISTSRDEEDFVKSTAHLGIVRADYHVVKNWDILVEGRALWLEQLEQVDYGVLAGVYRHVGDNLKIGVGYNFGRFSDDLTDLTLDDKGFFVNVVGKF
ncbi:MAG: transporter, partial [Nitratireductor sp.]|nr:transporter [Nitratireductor sp.]